MTSPSKYEAAALEKYPDQDDYVQCCEHKAFVAGCAHADPIAHKEGWNTALAAVGAAVKQGMDISGAIEKLKQR